MGNNNSTNKTDTIGWNNVNTDVFSPTKQFNNQVSKDVKQLISNLNIPALSETTANSNIFNSIFMDGGDVNKLLNNVDKQQETKLNLSDISDTSIFITSDMYNYFIKNNEQQGGSVNNILDDDSDTSTTSTFTEVEEILYSSEKEILEKKKRRKEKRQRKHSQNINDEDEDLIDSELSGGDGNDESTNELSYLSSSAHTDGDFSNDTDDVDLSDDTSVMSDTTDTTDTSVMSGGTDCDGTSVSNDNMENTSISINTSEINMISDY
jgi:hypothetical protein